MATRTTTEILAHYGLTNPHDSVRAYLAQAIRLGEKLRLKALRIVVEGKSTLLAAPITYRLSAEDQWGQPIASSSDSAADVLAEIARANAHRFGRSQRGEWPPKSTPVSASQPLSPTS